MTIVVLQLRAASRADRGIVPRRLAAALARRGEAHPAAVGIGAGPGSRLRIRRPASEARRQRRGLLLRRIAAALIARIAAALIALAVRLLGVLLARQVPAVAAAAAAAVAAAAAAFAEVLCVLGVALRTSPSISVLNSTSKATSFTRPSPDSISILSRYIRPKWRL